VPLSPTFDCAGLPYRMPPAGERLRLALVGQRTYFEACALGPGHPALNARFIDFRYDANARALVAALEEFRPHVVIVFRPEIIPPGLFRDLPAATLGFLTEPIPRMGRDAHHDLEKRWSELERVDSANFDRFVSFDPLIADTAQRVIPIWRSLPLPVADRFFARARRIEGLPNVVFVGRSTPYRESYLLPSKHEFDLLHLAFGVGADRLVEVMREHDVGINLHNEEYPSFENRICLHLAAGHLVLSEPLSPTHGLEPGLDYVEIHSPGQLQHMIAMLRRFPNMHHRVRVRGRRKAEDFRASRVYPRLVADLLRDLAAFGTRRASPPHVAQGAGRATSGVVAKAGAASATG
jgi:hypothetical protein